MVVTDDQSLTDSVAVTVTVSDVNEGPAVAGLQSLSFAREPGHRPGVGDLCGHRPRGPERLDLSVEPVGRDAGDFAVSEGGELSFRNVPDYEAPADSGRDNVYNVSVRASDGRNYGTLEVTVTVEDVNEMPVITTTSRTSFTYRENATATIYTFSATDPERADISWSLAGPDDDDFAIFRGLLTFKTLRDFENPADSDGDNVYEVTVEATDSERNRAELQVEVAVVDQNEGPEISGPQSLSFTENQATDRVLATYAATDPEGPERLDLSVEPVGPRREGFRDQRGRRVVV